MTLLLTNDEVDRLLDMRECLDVFESAYRELGQGIGVTRTVSQVFTPTRHSPYALYSFKSMDGVAPFLDVAAIRLTSEILTWPKDAQGHAKKIRIGAAPNGRFVGLVLLALWPIHSAILSGTVLWKVKCMLYHLSSPHWYSGPC